MHLFKLSSKSPLQYAVLFLAVLVPLFILITLVFCIKTPLPSKKWLWVIFVLLGVGAIQVNWTNGLYSVQVMSVYLLGASASTAGPAAPWVISASLPLGAIIFWLKRRRFIELAKLANQTMKNDAA